MPGDGPQLRARRTPHRGDARHEPGGEHQVVPGLAESWTVSKDGLTYTFKLRKGVKFHDGTPLNAEAVKFSIERQFNPEHPANKLGKYPFANFFFGNVKAVEAMDDSTVRFVLKEPRASFLAVLTSGAASIVSPTAVRKWGADYPLNPVGTGPFRYVSWQRGQQVVLEKNPDYWKGAVKLDRVVYVPAWKTRRQRAHDGAVDRSWRAARTRRQFEGSPKVSIAKKVGAHVWYLGSRTGRSVDDKRVRRTELRGNKAIVKACSRARGRLEGPRLRRVGADAASRHINMIRRRPTASSPRRVPKGYQTLGCRSPARHAVARAMSTGCSRTSSRRSQCHAADNG